MIVNLRLKYTIPFKNVGWVNIFERSLLDLQIDEKYSKNSHIVK